jgi:hypothetical protein
MENEVRDDSAKRTRERRVHAQPKKETRVIDKDE